MHACGVTRNWRTYFISVRRVFLLETVVLQTVLRDIRAWSARFLVSRLIMFGEIIIMELNNYVSQITLLDILFFTVPLFFSNTYVLYRIRKVL